jgi:hypothetical protein
MDDKVLTPKNPELLEAFKEASIRALPFLPDAMQAREANQPGWFNPYA